MSERSTKTDSSEGRGDAVEPVRRPVRLLAVLLAGVLAAGCGDLTAGGVAETDVVVSGDAEDGDQEQTADLAASRLGSPSAPPVGDVTVSFELSVEGPDGTWIPLTDGVEEVTVDLSGTTEPTVASTAVDPGLYDRARLRVTRVEADLRGGLPEVGEGPVVVDFGDEEALVVERTLDLELEADDEVQILIDLNSAQWLNAATPAIRIVAAVHFRQALDIRVR